MSEYYNPNRKNRFNSQNIEFQGSSQRDEEDGRSDTDDPVIIGDVLRYLVVFLLLIISNAMAAIIGESTYWVFWYSFLGGPAFIAGIGMILTFGRREKSNLLCFVGGVFSIIVGRLLELTIRILLQGSIPTGQMYTELTAILILFLPPQIVVFLFFMYLHHWLSNA